MQVQVLRTDALLKEFKVILSADEIETKVKSKLKDLAKTVKVDGFRPGKVPAHMVEQRYGASARADAISDMVDQSIDKVLADEKVRPALKPRYKEDPYEGKDFSFTLTVECLPDVKDISFEGLKLVRHKVKAGSQDVQEVVDAFLNRVPLLEDKKKGATLAQGDVADIAFKGFKNDKPFAGGSSDSYKLEIGSNSFIPGFEDGLVGMKVGETRSLPLTFPKEYGAQDLAGQEVRFDVTLNGIQVPQKPTLENAEVLEKLGLASKEEALVEFQKMVEARHDEEAYRFMRYDLFDWLNKKCTFDLPEGLVDLELTSICRELEREVADLSPEQRAQKREGWQKEYRPLAQRRVRLGLALADIGQKNQISVTVPELQEALKSVLVNYPGQEDKVVDYYKNNPDAVSALQAPILENKVVDFIIGKSTVTEKEISLAAFKEMVDSREKEEEAKL